MDEYKGPDEWKGICINIQTLLNLDIVPDEAWKEAKAVGDSMAQKLKDMGSDIHFLENTDHPELTADAVVTRFKEILNRG